MAGDSEQTLQNHQQPNGGEPFLIGVSGGTASGKVRGPRALPARRAAHVAGARGPWQLQPATAWPARSSLPDAALRRRQPRAGSGRGVGDRRGTGTTEGPGCGCPPYPPRRVGALPSPFPGAAGTRGQGPVGEGRKADAYCFASRDEDGAFGEPPCAPPPRSGPDRPPKPMGCEGGGDARGGAPATGSPPRGCRAFREGAKLGGRCRGWDDSRGCCLLQLEEKTGSALVRKLYWFRALWRPGRSLSLDPREGATESDFPRDPPHLIFPQQ